jgi:hypothetical protein
MENKILVAEKIPWVDCKLVENNMYECLTEKWSWEVFNVIWTIIKYIILIDYLVFFVSSFILVLSILYRISIKYISKTENKDSWKKFFKIILWIFWISALIFIFSFIFWTWFQIIAPWLYS